MDEWLALQSCTRHHQHFLLRLHKTEHRAAAGVPTTTTCACAHRVCAASVWHYDARRSDCAHPAPPQWSKATPRPSMETARAIAAFSAAWPALVRGGGAAKDAAFREL